MTQVGHGGFPSARGHGGSSAPPEINFAVNVDYFMCSSWCQLSTSFFSNCVLYAFMATKCVIFGSYVYPSLYMCISVLYKYDIVHVASLVKSCTSLKVKALLSSFMCTVCFRYHVCAYLCFVQPTKCMVTRRCIRLSETSVWTTW